MSKMVIVEGNSNDKDNVRTIMVKGERGYSAYEIAVQNGYTGTEAEWKDSFLNAETYYNKTEVNGLLDEKVNVTDIIDNLTSSEAQKPLSAKQGKNLKDGLDEANESIDGLENYVDKNSVDDLVLQPYLTYHAKNSDTLYEGQPHTALQGLTCINDNIVFSLRGGTSNYANIVEINKNTGDIVRNKYVEVNHANSLAYDSTNNILYVASCNKYQSGSLVTDNQIFILDYTTLNKTGVISVNNIPSGHRIRSVYYDNTNNKLYGGDVYNLYEINTTTQSIVNTITLDTTNLDTNDTNQTLKLYKDGYVGIFLKGLVFWDKDGNVEKIIKIPQTMENVYMGELEDFYIYDNDDILIGSAVLPSNERSEHINYFSKGNLKTNVTNTFIYNNYSGTLPVNVYVDNTSTSSIEIGNSAYPFKDIQSAINFARNVSSQCRINIDGTNYENLVITGIDSIRLNFREAITVDGIDITQSNVRIENSNNLTIKGINMNIGKLVWSGNGSYTNKIEPKENSTLSYNNKAIQIYNSELIFHNITLDLKSKTGNPVVTNRSKSVFTECTFSNYDNDYAIYLNNSSECYIYSCTFNKTTSASSHNIAITKGSALFRDTITDDVNNYLVYSGGSINPSLTNGFTATSNNIYFGDLCDIPTWATHAILTVKVAGNPSRTMNKIIDLSITNNGVDTTYTTQYGTGYGYLLLNTSNNKLSITENKYSYLKSDGTYLYGTNSEVYPSDSDNRSNYPAIKTVNFVRM